MASQATTPNPDQLSGEDLSALVDTMQHLKAGGDPRADKVGQFIASQVKAGNVEPLDSKNPEHAGFFKALGSDLWNMIPSGEGPSGPLPGGRVAAAVHSQEGFEAEDQARKAAGNSLLYRKAALAGEGIGANVKGMEQSATEGDVGGVMGHAMAVPTVMAATAGLGEAGGAIAEHPAFIRASNAIKNVTPKQVAQVAGTIGGGVAGHGTLSPEGAYFGGKAAGGTMETLLGKTRANQPIFSKPSTPTYPGAPFPEPAAAELGRIPVNQPTPIEQSAGMASGAQSAATPQKASVYRDATRQNVPYAGELDEMTDRLSQQVAESKGKAVPDQADHAQAASHLETALKDSTGDVVDAAIPANNRAANLNTKAEVDFHLQRGDIAGAENALDSGAKDVNPEFDPANLFAQRQGKVPSTMEIRQKLAADADKLETKGIQQDMQENLQRHQWSAESEARREFIARNTTGFTKTWGTQAQRDAAHASAMAAENEDMTSLLQKSLEQAQSKKAQ